MLIMSVSVPSGHRSRYMPGHLTSGTMTKPLLVKLKIESAVGAFFGLGLPECPPKPFCEAGGASEGLWGLELA
jgi:hypothetical protein